MRKARAVGGDGRERGDPRFRVSKPGEELIFARGRLPRLLIAERAGLTTPP